MPSFIENLTNNLFDYAFNGVIKQVSEMGGFEQKGGTEILQHLIMNGASFKQECKFTIAGRKDNSLEIIISHPGMKDTICVDANSVEYKGFVNNNKTSSAKYNNEQVAVEVEINPNETYAFKINFYPDKPIYEQALKLDNLKKSRGSL
jgi:hypothetical protein